MVDALVIAGLELPDLMMERVSFETVWAQSRFKKAVEGLDLAAQVRGAIEEMERDGGFATFLSCTWRGHFGGSLVVFKDPWYRSKGRNDVACFGLVTASNTTMLDALLNAAKQEAKSNGFDLLRGPVNPPRSLFGYGVQTSGFDRPIIAGSSADPTEYMAMFNELDEGGTFDGKDTYYNDVAVQAGAMMDSWNAQYGIPADAQYNEYLKTFLSPDQYAAAKALSSFTLESVANAIDRTESFIARETARFPAIAKWSQAIIPKGIYAGEVRFPIETPELQCQATIGQLQVSPFVTLLPYDPSDPSSIVLYHTTGEGYTTEQPEGQWGLKSDRTPDPEAYGKVEVSISVPNAQGQPPIQFELCVSSYDAASSTVPAVID